MPPTPCTPIQHFPRPNNGTALGGDLLTLSGSGFGNASSAVTVVLNKMPCAVVSVTPSQITCRTTPRTSIEAVSVVVMVGGPTGGGIALYDASSVYFRYLDRWSAQTTWQYGELPAEGDTVWVPVGQSILVDITPPPLNIVLVEGEMVFDNRGAKWKRAEANLRCLHALGGPLSPCARQTCPSTLTASLCMAAFSRLARKRSLLQTD